MERFFELEYDDSSIPSTGASTVCWTGFWLLVGMALSLAKIRRFLMAMHMVSYLLRCLLTGPSYLAVWSRFYVSFYFCKFGAGSHDGSIFAWDVSTGVLTFNCLAAGTLCSI